MLTKDLKIIKNVLSSHGVIAFPTETVMGLGIYFDDEKAYEYLNEIKNRPNDKPYTLMLGSIDDIDKYAYLSHRDYRFIHKTMPGAVTILLHAKESVPSFVTHATGIIGIRVPDDQELRELLCALDKPLLVPSANKSGEKPCLGYKEVENVFCDEVGYIYKRDSLGNKPSTVVDLTGSEIKIIREGDISLDKIKEEMSEMKIAIGCDHGGLEYKNKIIEHLKQLGHEVVDVGTNSLDSCHYPIFGAEAAKKVASHECDYGIVICTSGEGIAISANKIKGIRCGIGYNDEVAKLLRQHNDANMIAFGQKFMELEDVIRRVDIFLNTPFEGGRHQTRVDLIKDLEK